MVEKLSEKAVQDQITGENWQGCDLQREWRNLTPGKSILVQIFNTDRSIELTKQSDGALVAIYKDETGKVIAQISYLYFRKFLKEEKISIMGAHNNPDKDGIAEHESVHYNQESKIKELEQEIARLQKQLKDKEDELERTKSKLTSAQIVLQKLQAKLNKALNANKGLHGTIRALEQEIAQLKAKLKKQQEEFDYEEGLLGRVIIKREKEIKQLKEACRRIIWKADYVKAVFHLANTQQVGSKQEHRYTETTTEQLHTLPNGKASSNKDENFQPTTGSDTTTKIDTDKTCDAIINKDYVTKITQQFVDIKSKKGMKRCPAELVNVILTLCRKTNTSAQGIANLLNKLAGAHVFSRSSIIGIINRNKGVSTPDLEIDNGLLEELYRATPQRRGRKRKKKRPPNIDTLSITKKLLEHSIDENVIKTIVNDYLRAKSRSERTRFSEQFKSLVVRLSTLDLNGEQIACYLNSFADIDGQTVNPSSINYLLHILKHPQKPQKSGPNKKQEDKQAAQEQIEKNYAQLYDVLKEKVKRTINQLTPEQKEQLSRKIYDIFKDEAFTAMSATQLKREYRSKINDISSIPKKAFKTVITISTHVPETKYIQKELDAALKFALLALIFEQLKIEGFDYIMAFKKLKSVKEATQENGCVIIRFGVVACVSDPNKTPMDITLPLIEIDTKTNEVTKLWKQYA